MNIFNQNVKREGYIFLTLLVISSPFFFDIYRATAFNIVPHDDYVPYLLYLLGEDGGNIPGSPTGYRLFSVVLAIPFYYVLPLFKFSLLEGPSDQYLKALQALSFLTYLNIAISAFFLFKITRDRLESGWLIGLCTALFALLLFRFTSIYTVDSTAILLIILIIYFLNNKIIFSLLLILSIGFNEKIAFLFLMLFGGRALIKWDSNQYYFLISLIAFLCYFFVRYIFKLDGHTYMTDPTMFLTKGGHTFRLLFTYKSIYLNWLPGLICLTLFLLANKAKSYNKGYSLYFTYMDFIPLFGLFIISIVTDMQFTIGRILLFCFPLYLPLACIYLEQQLNKVNKISS